MGQFQSQLTRKYCGSGQAKQTALENEYKLYVAIVRSYVGISMYLRYAADPSIKRHFQIILTILTTYETII